MNKNTGIKSSFAFSLIELMIVITIIGILASVAVPAYQDYIVRTRVANVISMMGAYKDQIITEHQTTAQFPTNFHGAAPPDNAGAWVNHDIPDVTRLYYSKHNAGNWASFILELDTDVGAEGQWIMMGVYFNNNIYSTYCGAHNTSQAIYVSTKHRPSGCKETSLSSIIPGIF